MGGGFMLAYVGSERSANPENAFTAYMNCPEGSASVLVSTRGPRSS